MIGGVPLRYAAELEAVRRAARALERDRAELLEAMRRARSTDPPAPLRAIADAAGVSHEQVRREVG